MVIDLAGKTTMADHMVVATGTSHRHLASMAEKLIERLKAAGRAGVQAEGLGDSAWVLIDAGEVIVHLFRAETRSFYDLEKLWQMAPPPEPGRGAAGRPGGRAAAPPDGAGTDGTGPNGDTGGGNTGGDGGAG